MAGEYRLFYLIGSVTLSASSTGNIVLSMGKNEEFEASGIAFISTGSFDITGITDASGIPYTNASTTTTIPSTLFPPDTNNTVVPQPLLQPLVIPQNGSLTFALKDTSGASNTVKVILFGKKKAAA